MIVCSVKLLAVSRGCGEPGCKCIVFAYCVSDMDS